MKLAWNKNAWQDYLYWQKNDKKIFKKINSLIKNTQETPFYGIGKPEALKHELHGRWSRRITNKHRLVYKVEKNILVIEQCRYHY